MVDMSGNLNPKAILAIWEGKYFRLSDEQREVFLNLPEIEFIKTYSIGSVLEEIHKQRNLELVLRNLRLIGYVEVPPDLHPRRVALCGACGGAIDGINSNCKCFG